MLRLPVISLACSAALLAADFPKPFNTGNDVGAKLMPAGEAVKLIKLPPGFRATVFAAEPDVQNPIACAWDSRGRLWVAENYTYADSKTNFDKTLRDRILIFEDTDHDGHFDKRTVFADNLQNLTSIELGCGGVFATAAPYLLFIPDRNGDDKPDPPQNETAKIAKEDDSTTKGAKGTAKGAKRAQDSTSETFPSFAPSAVNKSFLAGTSIEILLDGFDAWSVRHNFVNGLKWGPDGWLYGRHGIQATSKVGAPGTPDSQRVALNCCIWRYHPVRRTFEVVCWGGTNPWGLDWNAEGEGFFTNTVIGHVYHLIPGAHYERMYGQDLNPYIYQLLPQTADHHHFDTGKGWAKSRDGKADDLGGGHAHSGCMIYQGENWPAEYRGKLFTLNLHGRRMNCERLERKGSSYVAKHEPDFAQFGDPWFRGVELTCGPDGAVYVLDWSDKGECHEDDGVHRESGRIYKIAFERVEKNALGAEGDLSKWSDERLVEAVVSKNEWLSRQARQVFFSRTASAHAVAQTAVERAKRMYLGTLDPYVRVRLGWLLRQITTLNEFLVATEFEREEHCRAWRLRLWCEPGLMDRPTVSKQLEVLVGDDLATLAGLPHQTTPLLRLVAASLLRKEFVRDFNDLTEPKAPSRFASLCEDFCTRAFDRDDPHVAQVLWDSLVELATRDADTFAFSAAHASQPQIRRWAGRYVAPKPELLSKLVSYYTAFVPDGMTLPFELQPLDDAVVGIHEGLRGIRKSPMPKNWPAFAAKAAQIPALADKVRELNAIFGDGRALDEIRAIALDTKADLAARRQALESLIGAKAPGLRATLETLAKESEILPDALRGLAAFDDAAGVIIARFGAVRADHRPGVIGSLCGTSAGARALLDAIAAGKISRGELTPYHARQIATLAAAANDTALSEKLTAAWGAVRSTPDDKKRRIAALKAALTPEALAKADLKNGRTLFTQTCAACHQLYDLGTNGSQLGPNLTGSGRANLDYLLENLVDPSAVVPADFKLSVLKLKDGRVLSGFIAAKTADTLTLRTMTETQTLPRADVKKTETIPQSLMPEGQLDALTPEQVRDLIAFLMRK